MTIQEENRMNLTRLAVAVGALAIAGAIGCGTGAPAHPDPTTTAPSAPQITRPTTTAPATDPTTTPPASPADLVKPISAEQRNATRTATDYLDGGQGFSRTGLIDQLKFEGYSAKASKAAVDSLHADWNAQAALTAKNYLDGQAFSRKGLIDQLEFEGYTHTQAVYGVGKAGL